MAEILERGLHSVRSRRTLHDESSETWDHIKDACDSVVLNEQKDVIKWYLTSNGEYTLKSCYRFLIQSGYKYLHKFLWKVKMPPRVKVCMWLTLRNSILTKDNLLRGVWNGDSKCPFFGREEDIDHLFFIAPLLISHGMS